mmetsp:Transcript_27758/g.65818  ORF Transcript_27758/g.65818 Transcript_27758/m.65818 type:complete len:105 (+) Transcript_27758:765-1079(+)
MRDWAPDISSVLDTNLPCIFFCANDYSDVAGETKLMREVHHARWLLHPTENPFKAVTVTHEPGKRDTAWSCANSFTYTVMGREECEPLSKAQLLEAVSQLAGTM